MNSRLLDPSLNSFCRKYLVTGGSGTAGTFEQDYQRLQADIVERFMLHDAIVFDVYGENIPAVVLLNLFGRGGFERLIMDKAVRFRLLRGVVTFCNDDLAGIMPLQSGLLNSPAHSDPEASARLGLGWSRTKLQRPDRRALTRLISDAYVDVPDRIYADAAAFGHEGGERGHFVDLGLPNTNLGSLNRAEREILCSLATESADLAAAAHLRCHTVNQPRITAMLEQTVKELRSAGHVSDVSRALFDLERLPSFDELLRRKLLKPQQVPELRQNAHARRFRAWLVEQSSATDAESITGAYLDAIAGERGLLARHGPRVLRVLGVSALSAVVGSSVAGLPGALGGSALGPLTDIGIGLLDEYVLGGLLGGWSPRHFFTRAVRPIAPTEVK